MAEAKKKKAAPPKDAFESDYDPEPIDLEADAPEPEVEVMLDGEAPPRLRRSTERQWYVVHCYSGYENKVERGIMQRIESMGMQDRIFDVIVPNRDEVEIKDGKKKTVSRRVFPGYILVEMIMDEDSWYVVRNTPGVTGFVGMGNEPTPLSADEVKQIMVRMEDEKPVIKINFKIGQKVRVLGGPFNDFHGTVSHIDTDKSQVRVMVDIFGRPTPVELDFQEVEKA